ANSCEDLLHLQCGAPTNRAYFVEVVYAVHLRLLNFKLRRVVWLPPCPERDELLVQAHAVLNCGLCFEVVMTMARDQLNEALAFLEDVDDGSAGHSENAQVCVLLFRLKNQTLNQALSPTHVGV